MENSQGAFSRLAIRLFGPFDVRINEAALPPLRTRKGQHLLALLALRHPREVEREWLAANLWPDSDIEKANYNLRRSLTDLRSALGPARDCLLAPTFYTLCLSGDEQVEVDVTRFDALVRKGDIRSLREAVDLYRGSLLEGYTEDWVVTERAQRHQACMTALDRLASQSSERGDWAEAVRWLRRLVALEPMEEGSQRRLIEALTQQGDYAAAELAYREYRDWLRAEMNTPPGSEITALFRRLQQQANREAAQSVIVKKEPEEFPGYLPRPFTSFIGRSRELEEIRGLLETSRLVTLLGTGGIGKTRMAIQVAEQLAREFAEGAWFVDLAPLSDPALLPQATARVLGVREVSGKPLIETLLADLTSKHLLLILDNCEHLHDVCGQFAERLLRSCPHLRLLATSRQALGIQQEAVWQAPPLSLPESQRLTQTGEGLASVLPQYEAARLFTERAAEAMPAFLLTDANALATLRIVTRLDGLPLAIELAAARVRVLSVEQVAERLDNRFRLLTRNSPLAQPRQQTLRAAIDWSYDLLSDAEATLMRRLSVFVGGWMLAAAEGLYEEAEEVFRLLTGLVEKSLVVEDRKVEGDRRYRMLESIREYALERLQATEELTQIRARHASWYLRLLEDARDHIAGLVLGPEQGIWLNRLEAEDGNLRAVLEWSLRDSQQEELEIVVHPNGILDATRVTLLEAGTRMAAQMLEYWRSRASVREGDFWLDAAVKKSRGRFPLVIRIVVLLNAGILKMEQRSLEKAQTLFVEALELCREADIKKMTVTALLNLANIAHLQRDYSQAGAYFEEVDRIVRELGQPLLLASLLLNYGAMLHDLGEYKRSLAMHEESLAIRREMGNRLGMTTALTGLVYVHIDRGDLAAAHACFVESLGILKELGYHTGLANVLYAAVDLEAADGNWHTAAYLCGAADKAHEDMGLRKTLDEGSTSFARLDKVREMLGEAAFEAEKAAGSTLSLDEAIAESIRIRQIA